MAIAKQSGMMEEFIKDSVNLANSKEKESISTLMGNCMKEISLKVLWRDTALYIIVMEAHLKVNSKRVKNMATAVIIQIMKDNRSSVENSKKIKQMESAMMLVDRKKISDCIKIISRMEWDSIWHLLKLASPHTTDK